MLFSSSFTKKTKYSVLFYFILLINHNPCPGMMTSHSLETVASHELTQHDASKDISSKIIIIIEIDPLAKNFEKKVCLIKQEQLSHDISANYSFLTCDLSSSFGSSDDLLIADSNSDDENIDDEPADNKPKNQILKIALEIINSKIGSIIEKLHLRKTKVINGFHKNGHLVYFHVVKFDYCIDPSQIENVEKTQTELSKIFVNTNYLMQLLEKQSSCEINNSIKENAVIIRRLLEQGKLRLP